MAAYQSPGMKFPRLEPLYHSSPVQVRHTAAEVPQNEDVKELSKRTISKQQAKQLFDAFDLDRSGYLTPAKLRHFLGALGVHLADPEMSEMVMMFDLDGNGNIDEAEFRNLLLSFNIHVLLQSKETSSEPVHLTEPEDYESAPQDEVICLHQLDSKTRTALQAFDFDGDGKIDRAKLQRAAELLREETREGSTLKPATRSNQLRDLGLGQYISKVSHIALIVSDVGKSARFYSEVLGFRQIRRPNFDEHGAWFTTGRIELHLIKGVPIVHSGDDLIVSHISLETEHIDEVPGLLQSLGIPFRQNVSVPSEADAGGLGTNTSNSSDKIVKQYFIRDPDGYYIEICNCEVLEEYIEGDEENSFQIEGVLGNLDDRVVSCVLDVARQWSEMGKESVRRRQQVCRQLRHGGRSLKQIARALSCRPTLQVDRTILENLLVRRSVYGDVCQNESPGSLEEILLMSGNDVRRANAIMALKVELNGIQTLQPPAFYEQGNKFVLPPAISLALKRPCSSS